MKNKQRVTLARTINDTIGRDTLVRLYDALGENGFNNFCQLLSAGEVSLHCDGYLGFTIKTGSNWTSECFEEK